MHAHACEALIPFLRPGARVLDVGSGSGYLTHVLAELVKPNGRVVGLDHIQGLVDMARTNMAKSEEGRGLMRTGAVEFVKGDGRKGWRDEKALGTGGNGKWDAIHVGAAAAKLHDELIDQLNAPGRMFIPVEDGKWGDQYIWVVDKKEDGTVVKKKDMGVRYVPLTHAPVE
ncbi:hypothetical protein MMC25_005796 [Agyrium rufum]|nr:hypothetical protein [Agyrium rufum]